MTARGSATWCAHPRLRPGEAFSSWLHRGAQANGIADHTYCRHLLGDRPVWNRDIDRYADERMLATAAGATGESLDRLRASVLACAQGRLYAAHRLRGELPWVLPLGIRGRCRTGFGQQFCPQCLDSSFPWLRLQWRFAWTTVCTTHHVRLADACGNCAAPITLYRLVSHPMRGLLCSRCGHRLAGGGLRASQRSVRFQRKLERAWSHPEGRWLGQPASTLEIFEGLRALARGLRTPAHGAGLIDLMPLAIYRASPALGASGIEHWRLDARRYAMDVLRRTLCDWPAGFVVAALRCGAYRSHFDNRACDPHPPWLEAAMIELERPWPGLKGRSRAEPPSPSIVPALGSV